MFRLIIVEDEAILRKGICNIIDWTSLGFQLEGDFSNAPEALDFFREHPVDLVVTDIKMPEMSGIELAREVHALSPATKIIILTAFSDFDLAVDALRAGVSDYIVKSDFISQLPVSVKKVYALLENEKRNQLFFTCIFCPYFWNCHIVHHQPGRHSILVLPDAAAASAVYGR